MIELETLVALARLNPRTREILVDHALVGMPVAAICARDKCSEDAVAYHLRQARRIIGVELARLAA